MKRIVVFLVSLFLFVPFVNAEDKYINVYLFHSNTVGSGMTVLVDREGKPIITTVFPDEE